MFGVLINLCSETPPIGCPSPAVCHHFLGEKLAIRWGTLQVYEHVLFPGSRHSSRSRSVQEGATPTLAYPLISTIVCDLAFRDCDVRPITLSEP